MTIRFHGAPVLLVVLTLAACGAVEPRALPDQETVTTTPGEQGELPSEWLTHRPDGQPNIEGLWHFVGGTVGMSIEEFRGMGDSAVYPGGVVPTMVVDPPSGILPYHPWARTRRDEIINNFLSPELPNHAQIDPQARGWPNGVPRLNYYSLLQILQPPGYVVMLYEVHHEFRVIPLDGRPHPGSDIKLWMGDSRGRWEGNTLVVDATNHNDSTRFSVLGDFHSDEMQLTERWTFVDSETLEYRATIDDPQVYTRPWTLGITIKRNVSGFQPGSEPLPEGAELLEYAAVEGERHVAAEIGPAP